MEKIKSGIPGFDDILKGGIRKNSSVLVTGVPGTGKTIFGMQFIASGAKSGEPGLFVSCEEDEKSIIEYAQNFGFDFKKYMEKGIVSVFHIPITSKIISFGSVIEIIKKKKIQRVVLDSLTLFDYIGDNMNLRKEILNFILSMKDAGVTLIGVSEREMGGIDSIVYKPQDFLFDGLILLNRIRKGNSFERVLTVAKIRGQNHLLGCYPFAIEDSGVKIYPNQIPFSLGEKEK